MVTVDISFKVTGSEIPVDHGYALYSAISHIIPSIHANKDVGVHPISGLLIGKRLLRITDKSRLVLRTGSEHIRDMIRLSGKRLIVEGYELSVGLPSTMMLRPATIVRSRIVVIKGFLDVEPFLGACRKQLNEMGVDGQVNVPVRLMPEPVEYGMGQRSPFIRRTLRIHDKVIVGYAVEVRDLSAQDSIRLQERGLGGRRRFGCGIFVPVKEDTIS